MLKFEVIQTGSGGNAYKVTDGKTSILLEAGINIKDIKKAFNFKLSEVAGALITHEHKDHSKAINDVIRSGVNVYMSNGTSEAIGIKSHRVKRVKPLEQFKIGTWTVLPFDVQHDTAEPLGFLIMNEEGEKLLFATDTYYIKYRFKNVDIIAVECNYSEEILQENIMSGDVPVMMKRRLSRSHFSLENFKEFIKANDLSKVKEIWLLHMSDKNSNEAEFKKEIQAITGKPVYIG